MGRVAMPAVGMFEQPHKLGRRRGAQLRFAGKMKTVRSDSIQPARIAPAFRSMNLSTSNGMWIDSRISRLMSRQ